MFKNQLLLWLILASFMQLGDALAHDSHEHGHYPPTTTPTPYPTAVATSTGVQTPVPTLRPIRSRCNVSTGVLSSVLRESAIRAIQAGGYTDVRVAVGIRFNRSRIVTIEETDITGFEGIELGSGSEPLQLTLNTSGPLGAPCTLRGSIFFIVGASKKGERQTIVTTINGIDFEGTYR